MEITLFGFENEIVCRMAVPDPVPINIVLPFPQWSSRKINVDLEGEFPYRNARYEATLIPGIYKRVE